MKNFNPDRVVDLSEYLTTPLENVTEMQAIMAAETPVVRALWEACEDCMNDQFISEATKNGIARREKMLNIVPDPSESLSDRRFRVQARYNEDIPYTRRSLEAMLTALCGEDGYTVQYLTAEFAVRVHVELTAKAQRTAVMDLLERVLPYEMVFTVDLLYNPWDLFEDRRWEEIAGLTWKSMREDVQT